MKRAIWALLLGIGVISTGMVHADDFRVGYVDMNKVVNESKPGKHAKEEIEKFMTQRKESLGRDQKQLESLQQALEKDSLVMSAAQKQAKQKEFEEKIKAF